ncbi:MAG: diguanylate cyclase [Alphaproteobacteria bacterium]|nr:diguanylate cyclase [Alphaproteobacteria bacterium]MBV8548850.1 diguanylate cyclase [Alphaproteobacteria bacterium]
MSQALNEILARASLSVEERQALTQLQKELRESRTQARELEHRITELESRLDEEAHPVLTRPEFNREVARMLACDERYGGVSSVLYFDIENLETLEHAHGKAGLDQIIRQLTKTLAHHVRGSDIIGRLAADEFGILLTRCNNADAWKKAQALTSSLVAHVIELNGTPIKLDICYGAYTFEGQTDIHEGIKEAAQNIMRCGG